MLGQEFRVEVKDLPLFQPDRQCSSRQFAQCVTELAPRVIEGLDLRFKVRVEWRQFQPIDRCRRVEFVTFAHTQTLKLILGKNHRQGITQLPDPENCCHLHSPGLPREDYNYSYNIQESEVCDDRADQSSPIILTPSPFSTSCKRNEGAPLLAGLPISVMSSPG